MNLLLGLVKLFVPPVAFVVVFVLIVGVDGLNGEHFIPALLGLLFMFAPGYWWATRKTGS